MRDAIARDGELRPDSHWATALWLTRRDCASSTCVRPFCSRALRRRMPKEWDTACSNRRGTYIAYLRANHYCLLQRRDHAKPGKSLSDS